MTTDRVAVCFFGVIPRSIRYTYESIVANIIDPLKEKYEVDIYVFNLDVGDTPVDDMPLCGSDVSIIPATCLEQRSQHEVDKELDCLVAAGICKMRSDYTPKSIRNSLRQMYSEYRVGKWLEENQSRYKAAVVCGPDYYILNKLNMTEVDKSMCGGGCMYTSAVNDAGGYTNGFYIGSLSPMINILKRYEIINRLLPTNNDYEHLVKRAFEINGITRCVSDMLFLKIRRSKKIARQGVMIHAKFNQIVHDVQKRLDPIT